MGKLTAKKVESLIKPGRYSDEDGTGFHVRVDAAGRKYFILRTHIAGKRKDIAIGSAARMTLGAAREKARRVREQIETAGGVAVAMPTFAEAAVLAHKARTADYRNTKHVAQWLSTLETYANPLIGEKPVDAIERGDVVAILSPIWLAKKETASRVLQRIDRVMRWAVGSGHRNDRIDMRLVRDALPSQKRKRSEIRRMPSIPWQDAPAFWTALPASRSAPEIRLGLTLLMLTAARPGNIASAKRSQVDLDAAIWTIPADEMKSGEPHRVPLSGAAVFVLRAIMAGHDGDLLFAVNAKPLSPDTLRMTMRRLGYMETPHGFRSTFKEWSRAHGWADHLSEVALAHVDPNEVRAAYARADLLEERRPMMEAWAQYLAESPHNPAGIQRE